MRKLKRMGIIILVLALVLFIFSNRKSVEVDYFLGTVSISLILLMVCNVLIGFALGVYVARNMGKKEEEVGPTRPSPESKVTENT